MKETRYRRIYIKDGVLIDHKTAYVWAWIAAKFSYPHIIINLKAKKIISARDEYRVMIALAREGKRLDL